MGRDTRKWHRRFQAGPGREPHCRDCAREQAAKRGKVYFSWGMLAETECALVLRTGPVLQ